MDALARPDAAAAAKQFVLPQRDENKHREEHIVGGGMKYDTVWSIQ